MKRLIIWALVIVYALFLVFYVKAGEEREKSSLHDSSSEVQWSSLLDSARIGDLLFLAKYKKCGKGCEDNAQHSGIGYGYFSHVALIADKDNKNLIVVHAANEKLGIITSLYGYDDLKKDYESVRLFRVNISTENAAKVVKDTMSKYRKEAYASKLEILRESYLNDTKPINTCSGFVIKAFKEHNVDLSDAGRGQMRFFTPDTVANSSNLEPMEGVDFFITKN